MAVSLSRERSPVLSARLAALDLSGLDSAELAEVGATEAASLAGGRRAAVWRHRPELGRFVLEQKGREIRSLEVEAQTAEVLFEGPRVWRHLDQEPAAFALAEASFGVPGTDAVELLAIPLPRPGGAPLGLVLIERDATSADQEPDSNLGPFAEQLGALLANHEALDGAKRHEAQLEALYETAGELSSKLELQRVLEAIIERARSLVGAPIAYITLLDQEANEIFMRASVGTTRASFRKIRLALGAGLGGLAAQRRQPFYTSDYLNDARFDHRGEVDREVRGENIRSILGVPMMSADQFIGVLYTADRRVRVFSQADIDILLSLADHAAVAIENASLYERATAALAEASAMNEVVREQNRLLRRVDDAHGRLSESLLAGHGLPEIVTLLGELLGGSVAVLDQRGRLLAATGDGADDLGARLGRAGLEPAQLDREERATLNAAGRDFTSQVLPAAPPHRARPRLVVPVIATAELLGSVWVETEPDAIERDRPVIEQAARVVALELLKQRAVTEVERQLRSELLDGLLTGWGATGDALERHAAELGIDLRVPHRLAVISIHARRTKKSTATARADLLAALRVAPWCVLTGEHRDRVVALLPGENDGLAKLLEELGAQADAALRAVVSPPACSPAEYEAAFAESHRVLGLMGAQLKSPVTSLDDVRVIGMLFRAGDDLSGFVRARLGPLLDHDERSNGDFVKTLETYLEHGCSPGRTASALHVHVNTVYYRLGRLKELLGEDFAHNHRALELQVALLANRLTTAGLENSSEGRIETL